MIWMPKAKNGVVGRPGRNIPNIPSIKDKQPSIIKRIIIIYMHSPPELMTVRLILYGNDILIAHQ